MPVPDKTDEAGTATLEPEESVDAGEELLKAANVDPDDDGGEVTPEDIKENPEDGKSETEKSVEKYRTLVELIDGSERDDFRANKTEGKRIQVAARYGFSTDEQIDEHLASKGKSKAADQKSKKPEESEVEEDDTATADDEDTDDKASSSDTDSDLIKAISPHLKPGETDKAVKALKNLQHDYGQKGAFVNHAAKYGLNSAEDIDKMISTLNGIDGDIESRLKSADGLKGLYDAFKIPVPEWLGDVSKADSGKFTQSEKKEEGKKDPPPEVNVDDLLKDLDEDGIVTAGQFKTLVPQLVNAITAQVSKKYDDQEKKLNGVASYVGQVLKRQAAQANMTRVSSDAKKISTHFGKFESSLVLKAEPDDIIKDSLSPQGKLLKKPHAEWKTLQKILNVRAEATKRIFAEAQKQGIQLPKGYQPNVIAYLSEVFLTRGGMKEATGKEAKKAQQKLIANLATKIQPSVSDQKKGGAGTFKIPTSEAEVAKLSRADKRKFLGMLKSGKLQVGVNS